MRITNWLVRFAFKCHLNSRYPRTRNRLNEAKNERNPSTTTAVNQCRISVGIGLSDNEATSRFWAVPMAERWKAVSWLTGL